MTAAYEIPSFYVGVLEANVDMSTESTWQFSGVDVAAATGAGLTGPAALVAPTTTGQTILGVLQNNPKLGESGQVMAHGVSKARFGGSFNIGDLLMVTSNGDFIAATSGNYAVAKALQAGSSSIIGSIFLANFGKV